MHRILVQSGADITGINTVRKHLSTIKGGRLTQRLKPATIINLTVSDIVGDSIEWNTDWTSPDSSTLKDARQVLSTQNLWNDVPASVRDYLSDPTPEKER